MTVREITFPDGEASPGLVLKALELLGLEGRSTLKGPLKRNGAVVGCLVRFNTEADADKFIAAWDGFLDLKKGGKPAFPLSPVFSPLLPKIELPTKPE
ncbi:MAG: hypothetical protein JNL04_19830 [Rhodospirillaceae bacterium]|nr:hypothetical protein [Rhodospirillaceae bacterium]